MDIRNPRLTPEQEEVLFDKATELPFSGSLLHNKEAGTYTCANCGEVLFDSTHKYDSGSGWPSFDNAKEGSVVFIDDTSHGMHRTEIVCANCGGHLGHMFEDGPRDTTGMRYCVNSLSLQFTPTSKKA